MTSLNEWLGLTNKELKELGFSDEEIIQAMNETNVTKENLTTVEEFEDEPTFYSLRELEKDYHTSMIRRTMRYKGKEWETWETAKVQSWRIMSQYTSHLTSKVINNLLLKKFPVLNEFQIDGYNTKMFFVKHEKSSLMVEIKDLLNRNVEIIKQKNHAYYDEFYHNCIAGKKGEHVDGYYKVNETPTAKRFYERIT